MKRWVACLALLAGWSASHGASAAGVLAPHRALYQVSLDRDRSPPHIRDASGELAIEWRHGCGGWTFEYRSLIEIEPREGEAIRLGTRATTWEDTKGRNFRFNVRLDADGQPAERIEGVATSGPEGGTVRYTQPSKKQLPLPRGTLFPIAHSRDVLRAAAGAEYPVFHRRAVFDGMDDEGAYTVNAVIGRPVSSDDAPPGLRGLRAWPVHLAYFDKGASGVPRFEMRMRLFANGVTDEIAMSLQDIGLRGRLDKIEILPSDCDE